MPDTPELRAVYEDSEPGFFEDDLRWQAQWHYEHSRNADGYERGGFYATEAEALEAAARGLEAMRAMHKLFEDKQP